MARKIFVSYKYNDSGVRYVQRYWDSTPTTARHYVDVLQSRLDASDHIYKGEEDGEDLSHLSEERIAELLYDRIYDSTVTIVLISKNMAENKPEKHQWIPREVSYSLTEHCRDGRISHANAIIAVVIPDEYGSYEYFIQESNCPFCNTITWQTGQLFGILKKNMFNRKQPNRVLCISNLCNREPHVGNDHSYIYPVKWDEFISNINIYVDIALEINQNISNYNLYKDID